MRVPSVPAAAAAVALVVCLPLPGGAVAQDADPAGGWTGAVDAPGGELAIDVTLRRSDEEGWGGTIEIPARGVRDFELSAVGVEGRTVRFALEGMPGDPRFEGEVDESGEGIVGTFRQGTQELDFALRRTAESPDDSAEDPNGADPGAGGADVPPEPVPGEGPAGR